MRTMSGMKPSWRKCASTVEMFPLRTAFKKLKTDTVCTCVALFKTIFVFILLSRIKKYLKNVHNLQAFEGNQSQLFSFIVQHKMKAIRLKPTYWFHIKTRIVMFIIKLSMHSSHEFTCSNSENVDCPIWLDILFVLSLRCVRMNRNLQTPY